MIKSSDQEHTITQFFRTYEDSFNRGLSGNVSDIAGTAAAFADCFIAAGPAGVQCGRNDEQFLATIPQGYEFYRSVGISSMNIVSTRRTDIDGLHVMVTVTWKCEYRNKEDVAGSMVFDVSYLLQMIKESCKIFAYITGDEPTALKEHGLI